MKILTTTILISFFLIPGFGQEVLQTFQGEKVRFIENKMEPYFFSYYVLKRRKKVYHGPYEGRKDGLKLVEGSFMKGVEKGIWKYYQAGEVFQIYDYDKATFLLRKTEFPGKKHIIIAEGKAIIDSLEVEATVVGGYKVLYAHLSRHLKPFSYMQKIQAENETIRAMVIINEKGHFQKFEYIDTPPKRLLATFDRAFESAKELRFFPALKNGVPVTTGIVLTLNYNVFGEGGIEARSDN